MPRSSESVASLAAALAKAQAELVNPEKSLTAMIPVGRGGEGARSFRYAPLASGLEIVRTTLGRHEIATVQTTAIDAAAGTVNLTTMLAHASGEWIASDWPVCPVAETANPQRMGAALTYARRYALFTLVGIAGEDDVDAPDLGSAPGTGEMSRAPEIHGAEPGRKASAGSLGGLRLPPRRRGNDHGGGATPRMPVLCGEQSADLRDRLVDEIATLASWENATAWAKGALATKNRLTGDDAKAVEQAFEGRLSALPQTTGAETEDALNPQGGSLHESRQPQPRTNPSSAEVAPRTAPEDEEPGRVDKSVLTHGAPRRYRSRDHIRFVAHRPCLVCGRKPSDPHHLRFVQPRALGRKASDEFTVPLCRIHHREVHQAGDERAWWMAADIDPLRIARALWRKSRMVHGPANPNRQPVAEVADAAAPSKEASGRRAGQRSRDGNPAAHLTVADSELRDGAVQD